MKQTLADNGLEYLELEFLTDWFIDSGDERRKAAGSQRWLLLEAGSVLESDHMKMGTPPERRALSGRLPGNSPGPAGRGVGTREGA